jgi:oligopeptide/dipeptide ABC transporter ATP-binding protein
VTPLVETRRLAVDFRVSAREWRGRRQQLRALDGVDLTVAHGETLALVGESGCGKTTLGRTLLKLYEPTEGSVWFDGSDLASLSGSQLRQFRAQAQMIFQDPFASLNPRMKVEQIIAEPLRAHREGSHREQRARVAELLTLVGLPGSAASRFPHAFSGGQRQRIGIARALALRPRLIVADEPVSALDVSIQAQIVNLLKDVQEEFGVTLLVIAHDLAVVRNIAERVAVMYLGRLVEVGVRDEIFAEPLHPYTRALLSAVPVADPVIERARERIVLQGDVPSPIAPPSGCRFHTRCPSAFEPCPSIDPPLRATPSGRLVACHLVHPPDA